MHYIDRRELIADGLGLAGFANFTPHPPRFPYDAPSTAQEVTAGLDLNRKTALVTGCNSGIGYETMRVLALRGAHVLGTARSLEKGAMACARIEGRCPPWCLNRQISSQSWPVRIR